MKRGEDHGVPHKQGAVESGLVGGGRCRRGRSGSGGDANEGRAEWGRALRRKAWCDGGRTRETERARAGGQSRRSAAKRGRMENESNGRGIDGVTERTHGTWMT